MLDAIAVILARGGSKRLPRKNLRMICGRPLVEWTLLAACQSRIKYVAISSDDDHILDVARAYRSIRVHRPSMFATDDASPYQAILHAIQEVRKSVYDPAPNVVLLQPTSPLRDYATLDSFMNLYTGHPMASTDEQEIQNGAIYAAPITWIQQGHVWDEPSVYSFKMGNDDSVDINTYSDLCVAAERLERKLWR